MVEVTHDGRYFSEAHCGGVHGRASPKFHWVSFAVSGDTEVCAKALQCWLSFVQVRRWDGAGARGCPDLNLGRLQLKVDGEGGVRCKVDGGWDVLRLDPDVPVVQVCPQLGSVVQGALGLGKDVP